MSRTWSRGEASRTQTGELQGWSSGRGATAVACLPPSGHLCLKKARGCKDSGDRVKTTNGLLKKTLVTAQRPFQRGFDAFPAVPTRPGCPPSSRRHCRLLLICRLRGAIKFLSKNCTRGPPLSGTTHSADVEKEPRTKGPVTLETPRWVLSLKDMHSAGP